MQKTRKQTHICRAMKSRSAVILLVGCLLGGGTNRFLGAQTVSVSVWSSERDHSLNAVLMFQSQSRERTDAYIHVYDDILAQQIAQIDVAAPSGHATVAAPFSHAAHPPGASATSGAPEAEPSMDQEADTLIVRPLKNGAETISSAAGSNIDFLLMTQLFIAVKPRACRIASGV
jgi:hypothetical protein